MGHKTSQCFLFRDLVNNASKEGRIKFANKGETQIKIDSDPLQIEANYTEPIEINMVEVTKDLEINMVEITEDLEVNMVEVTEDLKVNMVEVTKDLDMEVEGKVGENSEEQMKVVYPKAEEELVDFLNLCKLKYSEVMLCPRCLKF